METGERFKDAAKLLIVGMVRQISGCGFGLGTLPARSLF